MGGDEILCLTIQMSEQVDQHLLLFFLCAVYHRHTETHERGIGLHIVYIVIQILRKSGGCLALVSHRNIVDGRKGNSVPYYLRCILFIDSDELFLLPKHFSMQRLFPDAKGLFPDVSYVTN